MSDEIDFRPLAQNRRADETRLGRELHTLFPQRSDLPPEELWIFLEPLARRAAERNRRWYFARNLFASFRFPRLFIPVAAFASIAAILVIVSVRHAQQSHQTPPGPLAVEGTESSPRLAQLVSGAVIDVTGEVTVDDSSGVGDRVLLHSGSVRATVPHLSPGRTFTVSTLEADVIVRGTRFTVRESDSGTSVDVEEGLVEVRPLDGHRGTSFVKPGERLMVAPFAAYVAGLAAEVERAVDLEKCEGSHELVTRYLAVTSSAPDMSAAIYLEGVCAVRAGQRAEAIGYFERVAAIAPASRADNALARAAQLQEQDGEISGSAAWHRYLNRFPEGLHQELAHQYLAHHDSRDP